MGKVSTKITLEQEKNLFSEIPGFYELEKDVQISFTAPDMSSNGGLTLLSKAEKASGICSMISKNIIDWRNPDFIVHSLDSLVRQRVMQIACGYEDADDCDLLRKDPLLKMSCGRTPDDEFDLCSQPTMTRLENHVGKSELYNIAKGFIQNFIDSYRGDMPAKIILDLDDSNSNTYGNQQLSLFNDYYGEHCYMPLFIFEGYSGRMICPILRPGRRNKQLNVAGLVKAVAGMLRQAWPNTMITVRGDAMFCSHDMFEWADTQRCVHYCVGLTGNSVLLNSPAILNAKAKAESEYKRTGKPVKLYTQFLYGASSWKQSRWVIAKVEYSSMGFNIRFIVTDRTPKNMADSKNIYERTYCQRGECELWIKELKDDLRIDRMSCHKFSANQFRVFLYAAAYVLLWHVRNRQLKGTDAQSWTAHTLQVRILKSAVRVTTMKTKIKIEFGRDHPERHLIEKALRRA